MMMMIYIIKIMLMLSGLGSIKKMATLSEQQEKLKNRFFVIRHGQAENNVQKVLVSKPEIGIHQYGLTDTGKQQAKDAAENFLTLLSSETNIEDRVLIVSSDFKRTRETAEIIHTNLHIKEPIRFEPAIRERGLGEMVEYELVHEMWAEDSIDPTHNKHGVESLLEMLIRVSRLVQQLDKEYTDRIILLVSHGDPCQCIHSAFQGIVPNDFRKQKHYENCEIRELKNEQNV